MYIQYVLCIKLCRNMGIKCEYYEVFFVIIMITQVIKFFLMKTTNTLTRKVNNL